MEQQYLDRTLNVMTMTETKIGEVIWRSGLLATCLSCIITDRILFTSFSASII